MYNKLITPLIAYLRGTPPCLEARGRGGNGESPHGLTKELFNILCIVKTQRGGSLVLPKEAGHPSGVGEATLPPASRGRTVGRRPLVEAERVQVYVRASSNQPSKARAFVKGESEAYLYKCEGLATA